MRWTVTAETGKTIPQIALNGCCSALSSPRSSSARATDTSSATTWRRRLEPHEPRQVAKLDQPVPCEDLPLLASNRVQAESIPNRA